MTRIHYTSLGVLSNCHDRNKPPLSQLFDVLGCDHMNVDLHRPPRFWPRQQDRDAIMMRWIALAHRVQLVKHCIGLDSRPCNTVSCALQTQAWMSVVALQVLAPQITDPEAKDCSCQGCLKATLNPKPCRDVSACVPPFLLTANSCLWLKMQSQSVCKCRHLTWVRVTSAHKQRCYCLGLNPSTSNADGIPASCISSTICNREWRW